LLRGLRTAVLEDKVPEFTKDFFLNYYKDEKDGIPAWIHNALKECGLSLK
jgi:hypothetical protein